MVQRAPGHARHQKPTDEKQAWIFTSISIKPRVILRCSLVWKSLVEKIPWCGRYGTVSAPQTAEERPTPRDVLHLSRFRRAAPSF